MNKILSLYAVRNQDGKYFKNIGYGGTGKNWADSLDKARIYAKIGQARGRITWFAEQYPEFGRCDLVELVVEKVVIVDDSETIKKNREKKLKYKIRKTQQMLGYVEKQKLKDRYPYEQELNDLKSELENLKQK